MGAVVCEDQCSRKEITLELLVKGAIEMGLAEKKTEEKETIRKRSRRPRWGTFWSV